jgi:hypothetical protein
MMRAFRAGGLWMLTFVSLGSGCVEPEDNPTNVKDLRVLGIALEPPELMAPDCESFGSAVTAFGAGVQLSALVVDPAGEGRAIEFDLAACADPEDDRLCNERPAERVELARGTLTAGIFTQPLVPGLLELSDGSLLLRKVFEEDAYRGLGGLRLPLVLHLKAGEEELYAQKLMVFTCKAYPESAANLNPALPGLRVQGETWVDDPLPVLQGTGPFEMLPEPFEELQQSYVVPSLSLAPVFLTESWRVSWHTTLGTMAPYTTGGTDLGGQESRHRVEWSPQPGAPEQDVTFFVVVRDGRGGTSWALRRLRYVP